MPQFKRRPIPLTLAVLFSTTGVASAQNTLTTEKTLPEVKVQSAPEGEGFRTDTTRGATRTDTPLRDVPQFINTIPQSVIRSQGATTLQDALRNVPGITYAAPEGGTQANQIFYMRGFQSGGNLFLDGVRDIGEYNRDVFAIEAVEVLKGPGGLTFGRGSTAGVINQVSKIADLYPRKELDLTLGSFDTKRGAVDLNLPLSQTASFRLVGMAEDSGSYRYPQGVEKAGLAPSLRFGIGTGTEVTLAYSFLKTQDVTDYGQPALIAGGRFFGLPPVSARAYYGFANHDYTDHDTHIATLAVDHRLDRNISLRNTLRWANYKRDLEATIPSLRATDANGNPTTAAMPPALLVVTRNHDGNRSRTNDDGVVINQTELIWKLAAAGMRHTLLTGLELARERLDRWNYFLDVDPATPGIQAPSVPTPLLSPDPYTLLSYTKTPNTRAATKADSVSVYLQDQLELTQKWKAVLGLRWEYYDAEAATRDYATGVPTATGGPFARVDRMLSTRAGLIWQPSGAHSYYVAYSTSYNPSGELGVYGGNASNLNARTELLEPEKNRAYEVGAEWNVLHDTRLRAALFRNEKTNARVDVDPGATNVTALAGKQRVDGLELELAGRLRPDWDIFGAYAYMNGKVVTDPNGFQGNELIIPEHSGSIWTVFRLGGGWEAGGGATYASGHYINFGNTVAIPSYWRWDLTAAYVQKRYEVRLNLLNVFDELYYIGGYQNSGNRVLPGNPRTALLTIRYKFD